MVLPLSDVSMNSLAPFVMKSDFTPTGNPTEKDETPVF